MPWFSHLLRKERHWVSQMISHYWKPSPQHLIVIHLSSELIHCLMQHTHHKLWVCWPFFGILLQALMKKKEEKFYKLHSVCSLSKAIHLHHDKSKVWSPRRISSTTHPYIKLRPWGHLQPTQPAHRPGMVHSAGYAQVQWAQSRSNKRSGDTIYTSQDTARCWGTDTIGFLGTVQ